MTDSISGEFSDSPFFGDIKLIPRMAVGNGRSHRYACVGSIRGKSTRCRRSTVTFCTGPRQDLGSLESELVHLTAGCT